jgi:hypothetical protein
VILIPERSYTVTLKVVVCVLYVTVIVFSPTDELSNPDTSNPVVFVSDVPSVYLTRIDNPVESKLSPERNSVFSGSVLTSISDTSTTVTVKLVVRVLARTVGAL